MSYQPKKSSKVVDDGFRGQLTICYGRMDYKTQYIIWDKKEIIEQVEWCQQINGIYIEKINTVFSYNKQIGFYEDTLCKYFDNILLFVPPEVPNTNNIGRLVVKIV